MTRRRFKVRRQMTIEEKARSIRGSLKRYDVEQSVPQIIKWMKRTPRCIYCRLAIATNDYSVDHILPRSRGGADKLENIQLVDNRCNRLKGDLTDEEFKRLIAVLAPYPEIFARVSKRLLMAGFFFRRFETDDAMDEAMRRVEFFNDS